jgi:FkbM family methyltransferase
MKRFARMVGGKAYALWVEAPLPDSLWVWLTAAGLRVLSWKTTVSYDRNTGRFHVAQGSRMLVLGRRARVARVLWSLEARFEELQRGYGLDLVALRPGSVVLDVGANIGEVSILFRELGAYVYAFEPDPVEFSCLVANSDSSVEPHQVALWNSTGSATFFLANDTGDSSLLTPEKWQELAIVDTITLDDWVQENLHETLIIDLIKLEAEGAEPEILEGAEEILSRVRFIAADVGFERPGANGIESTLPAVINFLTARNFSVVWVGSPRMVLLFRNNRLT